MAGYEDTRQKIISTLMGRPVGTEIQPENHQDYALNMLDYIRGLELIATSTLIGVAESNTTPVQPNSSRVCYIAGVAQNQTVVFENFIDENGNPISVTTGDMEGFFIILLWNTQYWSAQTFSTNIISQSESATFYYRYNIRKTYASIALMNADVASPIGTDGKYIKLGDIVTVVNSTTPSENGIYSYEGADNGWKFQSSYNFQVEQVRSQNTNTAPSSKLFDDQISDVVNKNECYNVTNRIPLPVGQYYDLTSAIAAVPVANRKLGLKLTYMSVLYEKDTLTVTTAPTTSGNIVITLNGVAVTVALDSTTDTTPTLVATKIKATTFTGWTISGTGATVIFTKNVIGACSAPIFDAGATGSVASFVRTVVGAAESIIETQFNGSSIASWTTQTNWRRTANEVDIVNLGADLNQTNKAASLSKTEKSTTYINLVSNPKFTYNENLWVGKNANITPVIENGKLKLYYRTYLSNTATLTINGTFIAGEKYVFYGETENCALSITGGNVANNILTISANTSSLIITATIPVAVYPATGYVSYVELIKVSTTMTYATYLTELQKRQGINRYVIGNVGASLFSEKSLESETVASLKPEQVDYPAIKNKVTINRTIDGDFVGNIGLLEVGWALTDDYVWKTMSINVYSTFGVAYKNYQNIQAGNYAVMFDFEIVTASNDRRFNVWYYRATGSTTKINVDANTRYSICLGISNETGANSLTKYTIGDLRNKDGQAITTKEDVTVKVYRSYITPALNYSVDEWTALFNNVINISSSVSYAYDDYMLKSSYSENSTKAVNAVTSQSAVTLTSKLCFNSFWKGKSFTAAGDSLVGMAAWQGYVANAMGMPYVSSSGIIGGTVAGGYNGGAGFYQLDKANSIAVDSPCIIILAGANDGICSGGVDGAGHGITPAPYVDFVKLGTIADKPLTTAELTAGGYPTTFYQGFHTMLWNIQKRCPKARIFVCTQPKYFQGYYLNNGGVAQAPGAYEKAQAIREIAKLWGFPLIDLWSDCGANFWNKSGMWGNEDGGSLWVHPKLVSLGKRMADCVVNKLMQYQPYFDISDSDIAGIESDSTISTQMENGSFSNILPVK